MSACCRCCEAADERGELDHTLGDTCPHPPCDFCQSPTETAAGAQEGEESGAESGFESQPSPSTLTEELVREIVREELEAHRQPPAPPAPDLDPAAAAETLEFVRVTPTGVEVVERERNDQ